MKKIFVLMLVAAVAVSITACKNDNVDGKTDSAVSTAENSVDEQTTDISEEEPKTGQAEPSEKQSDVSEAEPSAEENKTSSEEVEKSLKVYENFSKKYHSTNLWDSIKCYGRFKNNSKDGYYKKGDLVRIIGKYENNSTVIVYTSSGGVNFEETSLIEFLPKSYTVRESDRLIDTPSLPASQVLEDTYVGVYRENYGLPCLSPKEKYSDDYNNSLDVVYDKKMIVRYGKLLKSLIAYSDDSEAVKQTIIPSGSYVGIMSYSYGEGFGMFSIYNDGSSYTIPEYIDDNPRNRYIEVMPEDFKLPKNGKVYGLEEKTKILSHATIEPVNPDSDTVIKTVTPVDTIYLSLTDSKNVIYNIVKGDKLSVIAEENNMYICMYEDRCFRISSLMVKDYVEEKSRTSKEN